MKKGGKEERVSDIWVRRVVWVGEAKKAIKVEIQVGNIVIIFRIKNGKLVVCGKYKPEARTYDPAELWVTPRLFAKACRMAAAILFPEQKRPSQQIRLNF